MWTDVQAETGCFPTCLVIRLYESEKPTVETMLFRNLSFAPPQVVIQIESRMSSTAY